MATKADLYNLGFVKRQKNKETIFKYSDDIIFKECENIGNRFYDIKTNMEYFYLDDIRELLFHNHFSLTAKRHSNKDTQYRKNNVLDIINIYESDKGILSVEELKDLAFSIFNYRFVYGFDNMKRKDYQLQSVVSNVINNSFINTEIGYEWKRGRHEYTTRFGIRIHEGIKCIAFTSNVRTQYISVDEMIEKFK